MHIINSSHGQAVIDNREQWWKELYPAYRRINPINELLHEHMLFHFENVPVIFQIIDLKPIALAFVDLNTGNLIFRFSLVSLKRV